MSLLKPKGARKTWYYDIIVNGERFTKGGFPTKSEARAAQEKKRKEAKTGIQTSTGMALLEAANEYLDFCKRRYVAKTYKEKAFIFREFISHLGSHKDIQDVQSRDIEGYLNSRPTNSNWNKHRKNLCAFFQWAFRRSLVPVNPCLYVDSMPAPPRRKIIYTQEEMVRLFLAAGPERGFLIALYSLVARVNEINRLKWEDVNFDKREVTLWTRKGDGTWRAQVKPMNEELYEELLRIHRKGIKEEWVFPNTDTGMPFVDRRKQLRRICRAAGIQYRGFHAIRHSVASLLADIHKVSLPTVQKMLGHARMTTTERYVQSLGEGVREAAELLKIGGEEDDKKSREA